MPSDIVVDVLADAMYMFLDAGPIVVDYTKTSSKRVHGVALEFLRDKYPIVPGAYRQQVWDGRDPALFLILPGVGSFMALPDRWSDEPLYIAVNFMRYTKKIPDGDFSVGWEARHVSGDAPPRRLLQV